MKLATAANNLAQLCTQLGIVDVTHNYFTTPPLNNEAPAKLLQLAIDDVIKALEEDVHEKALKEIERVTGYASDSTAGRMAMLAWISQCSSAALRWEFLPEPPRQGPALAPGDVVVKAAPFPPTGDRSNGQE